MRVLVLLLLHVVLVVVTGVKQSQLQIKLDWSSTKGVLIDIKGQQFVEG